MLALHALWRRDQRLALWGEGTDEAGIDPERLAGLLTGVGPGLGWIARRARPGVTALALPSYAGRPLPSPELLGPGWAGAVSGFVPVLDSVAVPGLLLEPEEAAQLLGELWEGPPALESRRPEDADELWVGASLRWLSRVHDLAWSTVHRGGVLPGLVQGHARWLPVTPVQGWPRARLLARLAPPVVRAENRGALDITAELVEAMLDAETRLALRERDPLVRPGRSRAPSTPGAEAWLDALTTGSGRVEADPDVLTQLGRRLRTWERSLPVRSWALRPCFRLVEPLGEADLDDDWEIELLAQPAAEPSLLLGAREAWRRDDEAGAGQESYADGLARAARIFPTLRFALTQERPGSLRLDRAGALAFLESAAPELTAAGFGVLLPSWWGSGSSLGVALSARAAQPGAVQKPSVLHRDSIVEFSWTAAIGELRLTAEELQAMASVGQRLVRVRGQWLEADRDRIAAALEFLTRSEAGTASIADVLRLAVEDAPPSASGLAMTGVDAEGWLGRVLEGATALEPEDLALPEWFAATLRPYQRRGVEWLHALTGLGLGAVLADDMGLGKTVQVLALLAMEYDSGEPGATLVVSPTSVVGSWAREAAQHAPHLRVHIHHGDARGGRDTLVSAAGWADVVLTTYGLVQRDRHALGALTWRRIVLDEAQNVKNTASLQARAVRSLPARHRIALTGTPVENRLADLHAVLDATNPGLFGTPAAFKERYSAPIERDDNAAARASLRRLTAPFVLRRQKSDPTIALELPEKHELTVLCTLTVEQAGVYQAVVADMLDKLHNRRGPSRRGVVLSALTRLKQVCNHPALALGDGTAMAGRSGKLSRLETVLEEALAEGDRVLCFTQYAAFGSMLQPHLTRRLGAEVGFLHGGTPRAARDALVERFQAGGGPEVLLLSLRAGGTGLTLTAANSVVHVDRWWNPAVEDQASDRAFRIGQTRDVQVRTLVCMGTIEERIDLMLRDKRELAASVLDPTRTGLAEDWLADLSLDAVSELVALSADAVEGT